jgi:hypothetical protein
MKQQYEIIELETAETFLRQMELLQRCIMKQQYEIIHRAKISPFRVEEARWWRLGQGSFCSSRALTWQAPSHRTSRVMAAGAGYPHPMVLLQRAGAGRRRGGDFKLGGVATEGSSAA